MIWLESADLESDEEFSRHLDGQIEERLNARLAPEEARYALRAMGATTKSKEECRDICLVNFIDDFLRAPLPDRR